MSELLNPYQKTALRVVLQAFEENLNKMRFWLGGYEENGILYHRGMSITAERKTAALELIDQALSGIQELSQTLEMPRDEINAAKMISAQMNSAWVSLSDSHSYNLKGHGEIHPGLANVIDPKIDQLAQIALDLGRLFEQK